jgi:serine/threonine-protein kinase
MLTGRVPFSADTPIATMYRHVNEDAPPPSTIAPVQSELEDVVLRCLEKDPKRRFASAVELEAALLAVPLARGGDTMRLGAIGSAETQPVAPIDAAETQPIAPIDAAAAAGATAEGAVAPDDAKTETVAAIPAGGGGLRSRRTAPSHAPPRRSPHGRRPWLIAAGVVVLLVALAAVLVATRNDPSPTKAAARDAAREAAQDALPPETPPTFADAWSGLIAAIGAAQATEDISDHAAEELVKDADELLRAYREGDSDKVEESLQHLDEHLAKAVEDGEISPAAANAVEASISDLVVALQNDLAPSSPTGPTGDSGDEQGSDKHGGSPPHGEANGHEED